MAALIPKIHIQVIKRPSVCTVSAAIRVCNYSQQPEIIHNPTTATLPRGTGGRASFNGLVCTVFGCTGFIGNNLVSRLGKIGSQLILPYRGELYDTLNLKLCGDLGQVLFHPFHLKDEDSILKCIKYSNVVINLIGRNWETKNFNFDAVHVEGAARIARICKQEGVKRFVHLSCLNANPHPKPLTLEDGSKILKSKYEGELAVREEFPEAIIIRPSDVYGENSEFIVSHFAKERLHLSKYAVYKKGQATEKQPIFVSDVVSGIIAAIMDPQSAGKTYQFVGPTRYKLAEILGWFRGVFEEDDLPDDFLMDLADYRAFLWKLKVSCYGNFSAGWPRAYLHWEVLEKIATTDHIDKALPTLEDLGITPIAAKEQLPYEIYKYKRFKKRFGRLE